MLGTLNQIAEWLKNDPVVAAKVSFFRPNPEDEPDVGEPAIVFQTAPEDMDMPYVVTNVEINSAEDNVFIERMVYNVHVFVDNGDIVTAEVIAKRIELLLDQTRLPLELGIGIWRDSGVTPIIEPDPGIVHLYQRFIVRQF